jgi:o-succinylbenzoate synthase
VSAIVALRADKVRVPFRRPFVTAVGMWLAREAWIVRLVDADGRTGAGEAVLEPADGETAATVLDHLVRDAAAGARDGRLPTAPELEQHGAAGRSLRAAIDAARLDLVQAPAGQLAPDGAGVGVNATIASLGPAASAEAARQALEAGYTTLKLKAGAERETEVLVGRVSAVRAAVGPDVRLRLDVNGAWDLETATDRLEAIARHAIEYVEQPLAGDDAAALAELRRRVRVPIAADEAVTTMRAVRALLDADAVDVLVVKPARVGGPVAAAEIAALAADRGVPVVVSTLFETGVGIAAALAVAAALPPSSRSRLDHQPDHGLATAGLLEHDLLVDGLVVERGRMRLPGGEEGGEAGDEAGDEAGGEERAEARGGLGITVDERALSRFLVESVGVG